MISDHLTYLPLANFAADDVEVYHHIHASESSPGGCDINDRPWDL